MVILSITELWITRFFLFKKGDVMKNSVKYLLCFFSSVSMLFCVSEAGAVWLLINPGAVAQGTGEAQVAKADDAYASYYNPAGLGFIKNSQYALQHVNWLPNLASDVYFDYLGFNSPLGNIGTFGANVRYLNLGEQMQTNSTGQELGNFKSYMAALQLSFGTTISQNSAIGFSFKVFHQRLADMAVESEGSAGGTDEGSSTDIGFDFGYLMHFGNSKQHSFGLAVHNIGPPIDFVDAEQGDPAPTNMKIGFKLNLWESYTDGDLSELNFLFDMNKLLVASYSTMDWNGDGIISGTKEIEHSDEWYKGLLNAWLDDWYYGGDYDETIPSNYEGDDILTNFWFSQVDEANTGYADGVIGGYELQPWNHVMHSLNNFLIGDDDWNPDVSGASYEQDIDGETITIIPFNSKVYVPNYSGFCEETYRAFIGNNSIGEPTYDGGAIAGSYSMCYDNNGINYIPGDIDNSYDGHAWIDMPHDGFGPVDVYDVLCDSAENYDCTVQTDHNESLSFDFDGDAEDEINGGDDIVNEDTQTYTRLDRPYAGNSGAGEYSFNESGYGYYNPYGFIEKGSGSDRTFQKELEEIIYNFGFEYKYNQNFTIRGGFIYDLEGSIKSPTLGAGIKFENYGFDFGYTSGDTGHPRANTMFFSLSIDV